MSKHGRTANISREMFEILSAMPVVTTLDERDKYSITASQMDTALMVVAKVMIEAGNAQVKEASEQMAEAMRRLDERNNDSH